MFLLYMWIYMHVYVFMYIYICMNLLYKLLKGLRIFNFTLIYFQNPLISLLCLFQHLGIPKSTPQYWSLVLFFSLPCSEPYISGHSYRYIYVYFYDLRQNGKVKEYVLFTDLSVFQWNISWLRKSSASILMSSRWVLLSQTAAKNTYCNFENISIFHDGNGVSHFFYFNLSQFLRLNICLMYFLAISSSVWWTFFCLDSLWRWLCGAEFHFPILLPPLKHDARSTLLP